MIKKIAFLAMLTCIAILGLGCSSYDVVTVAPTSESTSDRISTGANSHQLWGLYQFTIDPDEKAIEVVPLRGCDMHLNAIVFLEPPPLKFLSLEYIQFNGNLVTADIGLRHPFLGLDEFTGFDVCGIFISNGNVSGFENSDLVIAGDGNTRLLNPDGLTRWWNPSEFPSDGTMFGYKDGLLGTPDSVGHFNCTLNGYKYYSDSIDVTNDYLSADPLLRGVFSAGAKNIRRFEIEIGGDGFVFNYAIDANWLFPQGQKPWDIPGDFPPNANRPEAWGIQVIEDSNSLWNDGSSSGGGLSLLIDVYDHFNADANTVRVESPGNFDAEESTSTVGGGIGYSTYEIEITDATPAEGSIELLISVESNATGYGGILPGEPVTAYFTHSVDVDDQAPLTNGWVDTWGDTLGDRAYGIAVDSDGNSYVTGYIETANYVGDILLRKYDTTGNLVWEHTWGGSEDDKGYDVVLDGSGNLYVSGLFNGSMDFDPGGGIDNHSSNGGPDIFLAKFDSGGGFIWAKTWGGTANYGDRGLTVAADDSGDAYISGGFVGANVDFDPGSGNDYHTSSANDFFISKFASDGTFQWANTWGGTWDDDVGEDIDIYSDQVYVTGWFRGSNVDFDPDGSHDYHSSVSGRDVYLIRYDTAGNYQWGRTWGGTSSFDEGYGVAVDDSGNIYVTGRWEYTIDFDPGGGVDNKTAAGHFDVFLSKFDASGNYQGVTVWGGTSYEICNDVDVDGSGNIFLSGYWRGADVDFDPGAGTDIRTSTLDSGSYPSVDIFLCKYDSSINYQWARTWGGDSRDEGHKCAADDSGNIWVSGSFYGSFDFAPSYSPCDEDPDIHSSNGSYDAWLGKFLPDGCW